jgi:prepilin-type N-terminal cleavage/methylation domain-containing protein
LLTINGVKMKKLNVKKGFSLIELLVVIAIIGILSAVGITAYTGYTASAKEQAARTQFSQT